MIGLLNRLAAGYNTNMRSRFSALVVVTLASCALLGATSARAHKRFARKEGAECKECHVNPEGGGSRNLIGQYYQAKGVLPIDRSEEGMKLVRDTVDRWMLGVLAASPVIRWSYTPVPELPEEPAPSYQRADDATLLRRLSLDIRGSVPSPSELARLQRGQATLDGLVNEMLESKDFQSTFLLYHKDLVRPRTGDYNTDASYTRVAETVVDGEKVYTSMRIPGEAGSGRCSSTQRVRVSPWWDRDATRWACKDTGSDALTATVDGKTVRCDSTEGQKTGACGCGPYMTFCYPDKVKDTIIKSMKEEGARIAMEVVNNDEPYPTILTADWSMNDGALEVFYAKLEDRLPELKDPDLKKPWRKIQKHERHSGILSTPMFFNFFYNGRRWAQRTFETFFCHEVYPDFDLLDDTKDSGVTIGVPYRDSPLLEPSLTVTESRACAACHLQLDGLARLKDRWDPFGRYHETTERGQPIPQKAILLGQEIDGVDGLGKALASSDIFADCSMNQVWAHMVGHRFQPHEKQTRVKLVNEWKAKGLKFKDAVRLVAQTDEYRAKTSVKLMTRELYSRAVSRTTDVNWKVGDKSGWEVYYDKLGGMDYRKIELRDKRPGQGHSLAQMKGAAETCSELITRELKRDADKRFFVVAGEPDAKPSDAQLEQNIDNFYLRAFARPPEDIDKEDKKLLRDLFKKVQSKGGPADAYRAVCTAVYGSEDFALF
jgi:hypothetical protein